MHRLLKIHRTAGLLLSAVFVTSSGISGCATQPVEVPVAVDCSRPPKIDPEMLKPAPTQYLLPPELQRIVPKPQSR